MYETCPRQYQYFQEYNFAQSRQREVFLGLLVHQTIEEMHRIVLDGKFALLNESKIQKIRNYSASLPLWDKSPKGVECKARIW